MKHYNGLSVCAAIGGILISAMAMTAAQTDSGSVVKDTLKTAAAKPDHKGKPASHKLKPQTTKKSKKAKESESMKGMDMKGMKTTSDTASKAAEAGYWTCPMHPEVHQAGPGKCPICGMNLEYKKSTKEPQK